MGGGIATYGGELILQDNVQISWNRSAQRGGGIYIHGNNPMMFISGQVKITNNKDYSYGGGGIYIGGADPTVSMSGHAIITDNKTANGSSGGGILIGSATATVNISGEVEISRNTAERDGGGIWIAKANLPNLTVGAQVNFSDNRARSWFAMDEADLSLYRVQIAKPDATWSFGVQYGYNNYDISYTTGTHQYVVEFVANGGSATPPQFLSNGDLVARPTNPARAGYEFRGWFADADFANEFNFATPITANTTIYAKWEKSPEPEPTPPITPEPDPVVPEVPNTGSGDLTDFARSGGLGFAIILASAVAILFARRRKSTYKLANSHTRR
jgi:uncharacterized repeat protein (TIGR02543 family)